MGKVKNIKILKLKIKSFKKINLINKFKQTGIYDSIKHFFVNPNLSFSFEELLVF